ncbi:MULTISPECIES: LCP family protein [Streptomyces]|jgi:LCP family protein required for cell wall assembly|uniref:LCP family protein required for cell wall assembly n=2 Tax=Streptomyces TaxID=1883 RepID=A0A514JM11_9ACTN|nr:MULTISPECIES: LCP family protein [Streptomyces]MBA8942520.1 LCP family protein required for cell wall assembly [Streptomyces calvus]MBA8975516.1 LCP family protein required for cell wall assembly [Streptomyces calvus]MYS26846.1 LytR family transcriptional regulator [Streptomyces sp. SID7804]QDI68361.1 transcriptional regulator [Streptomyces calvus]GGP68869.1 transcriptional regulator [Streptomyces calvus]
MSTDTAAPPSHRRGRARNGRARRPRRLGRRIGLGLLVLLLLAGGTGYWLYSELDGNIKGVDIDDAIGKDRPEKLPTSGQNILVLGSDSRAGANAGLKTGNVAGARSDTALVMHIPEGRTEAVAVSIPRDTLVSRPECTKADGSQVAPAERVMFNSIYAQAGPACVVKTVEKMSGVRMDHYMEIDFAGFKDLVDAIGGVTVTVDQDIHDTSSGLDLTAGTHRLDGTQSLQFVRTRHGVGDGSDLGRIGLQQEFMTALLGEIKRQDLLGSPAKTYKIADELTSALTTDSELASLTALAEFGRSMNGVDPARMETIMLPVQYDATDPNRVVAAEPQASALWKAIREDADIPESAKKSPANGGRS